MPIIKSLPNKEVLPQTPQYTGFRSNIRGLQAGTLLVAQQEFLDRSPTGRLEHLTRLSLVHKPVYGRAEPMIGRVVLAPLAYVGDLVLDVPSVGSSEGPDHRIYLPVDVFEITLTAPENEDPYTLASRFNFYEPLPQTA